MEKKKETEKAKTPEMPEEQDKKAENRPKEKPCEAAEAKTEAESKNPAAEDAPPPAEPDWKDRYARLLADFDNYKKRTARDREDTYRYAEADILADLLPAADNLALALANVKDPEDEFAKGVKLVYESFLAALEKHDAKPFDSTGLELDTDKMEAIATLPDENVEEGRVSNEVKRGWMHKGKVLRAAQVVVSSGKSS